MTVGGKCDRVGVFSDRAMWQRLLGIAMMAVCASSPCCYQWIVLFRLARGWR